MNDSSKNPPGSVTDLLGGLRAGDAEAVRRLWLRYFRPLARLASGRLSGVGGWEDGEDVALEAFWSLCRQASAPDGFPEMRNRSHLWRLLACITARRAFDVARKEARRRRVVVGEEALGEDGFSPFAGREPPAEFAAAVADLLESLPTDELRRIALARLEGHGNAEIARELGRSLATVERKVQVIRAVWRESGEMQMNPHLDELPVALALEIDALCDDFERHWRRADRRGELRPDTETFVSRISSPVAREKLRHWLLSLERDLRRGDDFPEVPGLILEEEIGRGGMGVVYRARRADGRAVALKLIPGAEHARWARWLPELADLRHPNLVPLEAFGTHAGLHYVVMPLVTGGDLKERIGEFRGGSRATRLVAKVADAVGFLHARGILHRDIKPSNILLADGPDIEPLVCDFGLANRLGDGPTSRAGTPAYMAPEQREGRPLTPAADVWGIGAVLRELLGEGDGRLWDVCRRCLEEDPAARFAAAELAAALRACCPKAIEHGLHGSYG